MSDDEYYRLPAWQRAPAPDLSVPPTVQEAGQRYDFPRITARYPRIEPGRATCQECQGTGLGTITVRLRRDKPYEITTKYPSGEQTYSGEMDIKSATWCMACKGTGWVRVERERYE